MFYTSYFGNINRIKSIYPDMTFISIAGYAPKSYTGYQYKQLAPKYIWWKEWHDKFQDNLESEESKKFYTDKYYETVLSKLDVIDVVKHFLEFKTICLLCYELPYKFCHRHIVADWLHKNGYFIEEFSIGRSFIQMF